ncbi:YceI family protein [Usitatibacter palustris]|uniref:Protein YceI n=1 Tax=Usitatibacter palustris TaxID=2732487 RepID=A0A6M4HCS9_9PROT|nr:YceI family protein [Usitatibacter palustris]QJR15807.1 Protein YceI [Usitatibacter palustris]
MRALAAIATALLLVPQARAAPEEYTIDRSHTYPGFEVVHLGISTQRGRFDKTNGKIILDREAGTGTLEIAIDTTSVSTGNSALDEALRGEDFFHVEKFPRMSFKSTHLEFDKGIPRRAMGELTLLAETKPVTLQIEHFDCTQKPFLIRTTCGADVSTVISRSAFGMSRWAVFIADKVKIVIQIEAYRVNAPPEPQPSGG